MPCGIGWLYYHLPLLFYDFFSLCSKRVEILILRSETEEHFKHWVHAILGMLTIFIINTLVIFGILFNLHYLLIPWLLIYFLGSLGRLYTQDWCISFRYSSCVSADLDPSRHQSYHGVSLPH